MSSGSGSGGDSATQGADPRIKNELNEAAKSMREAVPSYQQREKRGKIAKNPAFKPKRSRKSRYSKVKKPVRDSKRVYNMPRMRAVFIDTYLKLPGVQEGLTAARELHQRAETAPDSPQVIVIDGDEPAKWPLGVECIEESQLGSKEKAPINFHDVGETERCDCPYDCYRDVCINARTSYYCTLENCRLDGQCSNSVYESSDVQLVDTGLAGLGVVTTDTISVGAVIGNYCGELTTHNTHNFATDKTQTSEYALELQTTSTRNKTAYIDATHCGGMTRFINHSCTPNTKFVGMCYRAEVRVLVIAQRTITADEEVTVDNGPELWFTCVCGERECRSKTAALK